MQNSATHSQVARQTLHPAIIVASTEAAAHRAQTHTYLEKKRRFAAAGTLQRVARGMFGRTIARAARRKRLAFENAAIRRQRLGDCTSPMGYQLPEAEDVPLRAWLQEHGESDLDPTAETPGRFASTGRGR